MDALESALPLEEEEEVAQEVAQVQKELVEKEIASTYADALDNPLFTDNFKQAFIEAQARLKEEQAPMREKIDEEVAAIMRQVHAEREAEARGETYTQTADDPLGALDAFAGAMSGAIQPGADTFDGRPDANANANANQSFKSPPPRIESTQTESLPLDADILGEMLSASDAQLGSLRSALAPLEKALRSEIDTEPTDQDCNRKGSKDGEVRRGGSHRGGETRGTGSPRARGQRQLVTHPIYQEMIER